MTRSLAFRSSSVSPGAGTWMHTLDLGGTPVPVKVVKGPRIRRLKMSIPGDHVRVSAPSRVSHDQVWAFVRQHQAWLTTHWRQIPSLPPLPVPFVTTTLPCGGTQVELTWRAGSRPMWEITPAGVCFVVPETPSSRWPQWVRGLVIQYWTRHLEQAIAPDRDRCIAHLGRAPTRVEFRQARSLWGRLDARDHLMLNLALAMAPPAVIRYVWIHELCHLRERNHSSRFWGWVAQFCPDWKRHRRWLAGEHGRSLMALTQTWLG